MADTVKPAPDDIAGMPELADDTTATPDEPVAIELPLEQGDADAQPV